MTEITVNEGRNTVTIDVDKFVDNLLKSTDLRPYQMENINNCIEQSTIPTTDEIKAGDYVINELGIMVLIVSYPTSGNTFQGVMIVDDKGCTQKQGYLTSGWSKEEFRKFYGTITIKCS